LKEQKVKDSLSSDITKIRERVYTCYQCGICSGGCPVASLEKSFRPREIVQKTQHSRVQELVSGSTIWKCTACYNCYEQCPQNVKVTDVIMELQSEALKEGIAPPKFQKVMGMVYKNGLTNTLVGFVAKQREKAGLKEPPKVNIKAAQSIMEKTGAKDFLKSEGDKDD
jgi:heterodisulfide reductase subunit C